MERQKVYCEIEFFSQFMAAFPTAKIPSEEYIQKTKRWINFRSYLHKSELTFNLNKEDFYNLVKSDENYFMLWKKSTEGECGLEFRDKDFPCFEQFDDCITDNSHYLSSVYLSCKSKELCSDFEKSYGVKVIPYELVFESDSFFDVHIESIEKGDKSHKNWDFLEVYKHPCNSLAIVDNYILETEANIKENLIPILSELLPESLSIPFHLSIFTYNKSSNSTNKDYYELIQRMLMELNPKLRFYLTLHNMQQQDKLHDRTIITNLMLIDIGSGFDLFENNKSIHQTRIVGYYPFSASNININAGLTYQVLKKSLTKIYKSACSNEYLTTFWGDNKNRLFEN